MPFRSPIRLAILALAIAVTSVSPVLALEQKAFDVSAFKAAQDGGKAVIVHVTAPWCPTCTAQHQAIDSLAKNPAYGDVTVFNVDFDTQADVWKSLNARSQSTIIAYAGNNETGRIVGETGIKPIEALVQSTAKK